MYLSSTAVYGDAINAKTKKEILGKFNARPENIHGDLIRFIVMDAGYKEGIDLFDVKYVHIFEPQISKADQKQVIGRGTRTCGQKGLEFHPTQGWPLYVYVYDSVQHDATTIEEKQSLYDMYIKTKGIDIRKVRFAEELEKYCVIGSIDYELNKNIHNFKIEDDNDYYHQIFTGGLTGGFTGGLTGGFTGGLTGGFIRGGVRVPLSGGAKATATGFSCGAKCSDTRETKSVPVSTALMIVTLFTMKRVFDFPELEPRSALCRMMKEDKKYCKALQEAYSDPVTYIRNHEGVIRRFLKRKEHHMVAPHIRTQILQLVYSVIPKTVKRRKVKGKEHIIVEEEIEDDIKDIIIPPPPALPESKMTFKGVRDHIRDHYIQFAWPKVKLENMCGSQQGGASIVNFTPTQDFIRTFFRPEAAMRGMLLWHSVGTGKTCAAIATATSSFEKEGYTILWVTRTTLKSDIWKNMFDQVCSIVLQERMEKESIPAKSDARMRLLSKSWSIRPMSYKQFTNLVSGKNAFYKELVRRNGAADPLKKTLLIIDEAHKLYGGSDLSPMERPNMTQLTQALYKSYRVSGADSARVLMMSATPYTNDPMELIKLINLCKYQDAMLPDTYDTFADAYLNKEGLFTKKGSRAFLNAIAGHVSYLNRERDARQFAQPIISTIQVPISTPVVTQQDIDDIESRIQEDESNIKASKDAFQQTRTQFSLEKAKVRKDCSTLKGQERIDCVARSAVVLKALEDVFEKDKQVHVDEVAALKHRIKEHEQEKKEKKLLLENDVSQQTMLSACTHKPVPKTRSAVTTPPQRTEP
jgi:superfamily II DNA or RNA helicase